MGYDVMGTTLALVCVCVCVCMYAFKFLAYKAKRSVGIAYNTGDMPIIPTVWSTPRYL